MDCHLPSSAIWRTSSCWLPGAWPEQLKSLSTVKTHQRPDYQVTLPLLYHVRSGPYESPTLGLAFAHRWAMCSHLAIIRVVKGWSWQPVFLVNTVEGHTLSGLQTAPSSDICLERIQLRGPRPAKGWKPKPRGIVHIQSRPCYLHGQVTQKK